MGNSTFMFSSSGNRMNYNPARTWQRFKQIFSTKGFYKKAILIYRQVRMDR